MIIEFLFRVVDDAELEIKLLIYTKLLINLKERFFLTCSEKQDKVNDNLLRRFREQLEMLRDRENQDAFKL